MMQKFMLLGIMLTLLMSSACNIDAKKSTGDKSEKLPASITETGELQAVNSKIIQMPMFNWEYGRPKIVMLEQEGLKVKKGDTVGQIDTAGVVRELGQKKADLAIARADLKKLQVEHDSQLKALDADLQTAEAALKQARVNLQRVKFESKVRKDIKQLELEIAEISYQKVINKIKYTHKIQSEALLIQEEKIKQIKTAIQKAKRTKETFTLRAPADGIIEYRKRRWGRGDKIKVGDEAWPGEALLGLPDLSQMKVLTSVNETDIDKVHLGQKATVRLDAFPKVAFDGEIVSISKTCRKKEEKSKIKIFDIEILLEKSDPILRPGMTVSCEMFMNLTG